LPFGAHGKEGVSGSSPEEGSAKAPESGAFSFGCSCIDERWPYWPTGEQHRRGLTEIRVMAPPGMPDNARWSISQ
jgi:hypothetical protein